MIQLFPVEGLPIVQPGDDLAVLLARALRLLMPQDGDVLVVTSKIVSKAEGRFANLRGVTPSADSRKTFILYTLLVGLGC